MFGIKSDGLRNGLGFFVLWHINLCELFNAKAILVKEE